jgi:phospholipid/cholesterol/gamma-HCH transport system ATP-binding protein
MNAAVQDPAGATATSPQKDRVFIEVKNLKKSFGRQLVLRGVDLTVYRGETLVLIGPSGEGKTVLMKHFIGLLQPDSGSVTVDGLSVVGLRERQLASTRKKFGFLFQNAALFDAMTVAENVAFPLVESGIRDRAEIAQRVHDALAVVDLEEHKAKLPVNLSGGMRKRAGIARSVVANPQCVLYDEPTASLDPVVADVIDRLIMRLQRRFQVTSIVVTHDMKSVFKIADRVAMLKDGVIHFCGTPDELRRSPDAGIQDFIEGRSHVQG